MKEEIKLIPVIAEVYAFKKKNPSSSKEEIMQDIADFIINEKDDNIQLVQIAVANRTIEYQENNPDVKEKQAIVDLIEEFPEIIESVKRANAMTEEENAGENMQEADQDVIFADVSDEEASEPKVEIIKDDSSRDLSKELSYDDLIANEEKKFVRPKLPQLPRLKTTPKEPRMEHIRITSQKIAKPEFKAVTKEPLKQENKKETKGLDGEFARQHYEKNILKRKKESDKGKWV